MIRTRENGMEFGIYYSTGYDYSYEMESTLDPSTLEEFPTSSDGNYAEYVNDHLYELLFYYRPSILLSDHGYPSKLA